MVGEKVLVQTVIAASYAKKIKIGSTNPFLITDTYGDSYICKVYEENIGNLHLVNELVCYELAKLLDLPIPNAKLVEFRDDFINENADLQKRGLLSNIGFGSSVLNSVKSNITPPLLEMCQNTEIIPGIVLFDQLILNNDRATNDGNLLFDFKKKKLYLIDHSHVFYHGTIWNKHTLKQVIDSNQLLVDNYNQKYYKMLTRYINGFNPFNTFLEKLETIDEVIVSNIVYSIPHEWNLSEESSEALINFILYRLTHINDILGEINKHSPYWKGVI